MRQELLADAGLTQDQEGDRRLGDALGLCVERAHRRVLQDHAALGLGGPEIAELGHDLAGPYHDRDLAQHDALAEPDLGGLAQEAAQLHGLERSGAVEALRDVGAVGAAEILDLQRITQA